MDGEFPPKLFGGGVRRGGGPEGKGGGKSEKEGFFHESGKHGCRRKRGKIEAH